jgi:hypothetical protein
LGIPKAQAIGHLHLLWWWCADYAVGGKLEGYSAVELATAAEWSGDAEQWVTALIRAKFIDETRRGLLVHDWAEYRLHFHLMRERQERQRAQVRERMRKLRARRDATVTQGDADVTHQVTHDVTQCDAPKQNKINKTKQKEKKERNEEFGGGFGGSAAPPPERANGKVCTSFPEGWDVEPWMLDLCKGFDLNPHAEFADFKNHHLAKGSRFKSWPHAFRTWVSRSVKLREQRAR